MPLIQEEKIRAVFAEAKTLAIVSGKEMTEEFFLAKEALVLAAKKSGLSIRVFPEEKTRWSEKWSSLIQHHNNAPSLFSTSILIPKNKIETKEISYTEDDRYVSINISAGREEVSKENVVFKTLPSPVDAVFYFPDRGDQDTRLNEKLAEEISSKIALPEAEKIISAVPDLKQDTAAENIFTIFQIMEERCPINDPIPIFNLLFASLLAKTDQFRRDLDKKNLQLATSLINLGADSKLITNLINDTRPALTRLFGRALARSYPNESLKSAWSFLSSDDLDKTGRIGQPDIFEKIITGLKRFFPQSPIIVLLWGNKNEVRGMILPDSQQNDLIKKLEAVLMCPRHAEILTVGPYKNFSEAEIKIQNALKEILR